MKDEITQLLRNESFNECQITKILAKQGSISLFIPRNGCLKSVEVRLALSKLLRSNKIILNPNKKFEIREQN